MRKVELIMESQRGKSLLTVLHIFAVFRNLTCRNVAVYSPAVCNLLHQDESLIRAQHICFNWQQQQ